MKYLLDVNALVALGVLEHEYHSRVARWIRSLASEGSSVIATCSITELGFVRVLAQAPQYQLSVAQARDLLLKLKLATLIQFAFLSDDRDISHLPAWVKAPRQITDGHLLRLAESAGAVLTTLDTRIPRSFLIPAVE